MSEELFDQQPWFYQTGLSGTDIVVDLDDFSFRHLRTLRLEVGSLIILVDGEGRSARAEIVRFDKQGASARILSLEEHPRPEPLLHLYIALTKNSTRNEWLFEKATELGVSSIVPMTTERSEKVFLKKDRAEKILISAMVQSRRYYLPIIEDSTSISALPSAEEDDLYLIAHCYDTGLKKSILDTKPRDKKSVILFVGPEGDFTESEVKTLKELGGEEISLGDYRLRTETAAILGLGSLYLLSSRSD